MTIALIAAVLIAALSIGLNVYFSILFKRILREARGLERDLTELSIHLGIDWEELRRMAP